MFWVNKLAIFFLIWWFGGKFSSKLKGKLPGVINLILRLLLGYLVYWSGVILSEKFLTGLVLDGSSFLGLDFLSSIISSITDFAGMFIAYIILSTIVSLFISLKASEFVKRREFEELIDKIKLLELTIMKLMKATKDRNIKAKPLSQSDAKNALKEVMINNGIKKFEIVKSEQKDDYWNFLVKCRIREFNVVLDAYGGTLISMRHARKTLKQLVGWGINGILTNKKATFAVIITLMFFLWINSLKTPTAQARIQSLFIFNPEEVKIVESGEITKKDCASFLSVISALQSNPDSVTEPDQRTINSIEAILFDEKIDNNILGGQIINVEGEEYALVILDNQDYCTINLNAEKLCTCQKLSLG